MTREEGMNRKEQMKENIESLNNILNDTCVKVHGLPLAEWAEMVLKTVGEKQIARRMVAGMDQLSAYEYAWDDYKRKKEIYLKLAKDHEKN
jgi:hypothetical protein